MMYLQRQHQDGMARATTEHNSIGHPKAPAVQHLIQGPINAQEAAVACAFIPSVAVRSQFDIRGLPLNEQNER